MAHVIVAGAQWGDEGKGKIVDWLADRADMIVRFQGGHNAGHTLVIDGVTYALSMLPSGVVRPGKVSLIGNGVVIEPWSLFKEIETLAAKDIHLTADALKISDAAPLILPLHVAVDQAREKDLGKEKIGTTGRGIGPAYEDKIARRALRTGDLKDPDHLRARLANLYGHYEQLAKVQDFELPEFEGLYADLVAMGEKLRAHLVPAWQVLDKAHQAGQHFLFEGAQGAMLDIDHGTYPFVTSSNTQASNAALGSGFGAARHSHILGIVKAYTTRVGSGPFPTENDEEPGQRMAKVGHEFGVVTGRPRRCGWFDAVMVRQTVQIGGFDSMALTKLDVLDGFETLRICTGYELNGEKLDHFPSDAPSQAAVTPIYEDMPGWSVTTAGATQMEALPPEAKDYVERLEDLVGIPASLISTSPKREDTILRQNPFEA